MTLLKQGSNDSDENAQGSNADSATGWGGKELLRIPWRDVMGDGLRICSEGSTRFNFGL